MTNDEDNERAATMHIADMFLPLFSEQRWDEFIALWAEDCVLEFPYAPKGRRSEYKGKAEILPFMKHSAGKLKVDETLYRRVHQMLDPKIVIMKLGMKGHVVASGASLDQKYVSLFETKAGRLCRYREYWNPVISMDGNGGREAWTAGFGSPEPGRASS